MRRLLLTTVLSLGILVGNLSADPIEVHSAPTIRVFTVTQVVWDLLDHTASWEGRTILVRGRFVPYPDPQCSRHCVFRGGLSDTGNFVHLLTLRVTARTRALLVLGHSRVYRVRLHLGRYGTTRQPEGYVLGRLG